MTRLLGWCARLGGVGALILGLAMWRGSLFETLHLHMALGVLVAVALGIAAIMAVMSRVRVSMAYAGLIWAIVMVYLGMKQAGIMQGSSHWVIEVVHLLLGIGAIGLVEMLAGALARQTR